MSILEMMRNGEIHLMWFGLLIQGIALAILCSRLAKSKNRNIVIAFITGFIPILNYLAVLYYVGVPKHKPTENVEKEY